MLPFSFGSHAMLTSDWFGSASTKNRLIWSCLLAEYIDSVSRLNSQRLPSLLHAANGMLSFSSDADSWMGIV